MQRTRGILTIAIATVVVFAALRATQPVTLPLAFGVVLLLFFRPWQRWMDARLPRWTSVVAILLTCVTFLSFLAGIVGFAATRVAPEVPRYGDELRQRLQPVQDRLGRYGVDVGSPASGGGGEDGGGEDGAAGGEAAEGGGGSGAEQGAQGGDDGAGDGLAGGALSALRHLLSGLGLIALTLAVLTFLLIEVDAFREKVQHRGGQRLVEAFDRMAGKFQRYFLVQSFTAFLTGLLTWGWCAVLGVELAFVWGILAFALNFVPTVGSVLAVLPPTAFGLAFSGVGVGLAVLGGLAVIEFTLGNVVDPALQGEAVDLSPVVVLLSVVFWGWLWGVGGALIAVPLTIAAVLVLDEYGPTRPIATFLSSGRGDRA